MPPDPWSTFAEFYDHIPLYRERADVDFYVQQARAARGPVLELGCGSGRVLVPIAREGILITGLDASPAMLSLCRQRLEEEHLEAGLICGNMRNFELGQSFALVTIPFRPFQHLLEVEEQMACLASIRNHLTPGGKLVFDVFNPDLKLLILNDPGPIPEMDFEMPDGRRVQRGFRRLSHDRARQLQHLEFTFEVTSPDGTTERMSDRIFMRYFFRYELEHLLARCGFEVEHLYGDFDGRPLDPDGSPELIFVTAIAKPAR